MQTFVVDRTDGTADAIYGGDALGNVWRVDLTATTGAYPAPTKVAVLTDASGTGQPMTTRPLIEIHPKTKRRYILIGTGKLLATGDISSTQNQSFYAIIDGNNAKFNRVRTCPLASHFPIPRSKLVVEHQPGSRCHRRSFDPDGLGHRPGEQLAGGVQQRDLLRHRDLCADLPQW